MVNKTEINSTLLKNVNKKKILSVIDFAQSISRVEIRDILGKNGKTVTNITNSLIDDGLIVSRGFSAFTGGRRRELLSINSEFGYLIGLQLGIHFLKGIVTDFNYKILAEEKIPILQSESKDNIIKKIRNTVRFLIKSSNIPNHKILGIGFAANGFYDNKKGEWILSANNPNWKNVPVKKILQKEFDVPVYLESVSRSLALWEELFGIAKNKENIIYIDISSVGLGCAITSNGRLYRGIDNKAGEFGHTIVVPNGEVCTCGNKGCLETVASAWAIVKQIKERLKKGEKSEIKKLCNDNPDKINIDIVFKAYKNGDKLVTEILETASDYLSIGIANLINMFNPEIVILGGHLVTLDKSFFNKLKTKIKKYSMPQLVKKAKILTSSLDDNAAVLGAATLVRDPYFHIKKI